MYCDKRLSICVLKSTNLSTRKYKYRYAFVTFGAESFFRKRKVMGSLFVIQEILGRAGRIKEASKDKGDQEG